MPLTIRPGLLLIYGTCTEAESNNFWLCEFVVSHLCLLAKHVCVRNLGETIASLVS